MLSKNPAMSIARPGRPSYAYQGMEHDRLFKPIYNHQGGKSCKECEKSQEIVRDERQELDPVIHYGLVASGNAVIKNASDRYELAQSLGDECLCLETEAAGLMNNFPCLVVREICDYADSHKNDRWQRYAAAVAATYTKELLGVLGCEEISASKRTVDVLSGSKKTFL
jgi:nucleoside phosphorylase